MMDREKLMGFMMDMCCKGMSEDEKQKMKDKCKEMAGKLPECCKNMDCSSMMKHCFSGTATDKSQT